MGKGFISLLDSLMQKIIIDILHRASKSSGWAGGYSLPETVLQTATHALVNLSDIQKRSSAADFLAGMQPLAILALMLALASVEHIAPFQPYSMPCVLHI